MNNVVTKVGLPFNQIGKVANAISEIYDLDITVDSLGKVGLIVNTDRISSKGVTMKNGIPGRGKHVTAFSSYFFNMTEKTYPNHFITDKFDEFPSKIRKVLEPFRKQIEGRSMLIRLAEPLPVEAIVRFLLNGSSYRSYAESGEVCGVKLPEGLSEGSRLRAPIFTLFLKAKIGSDQPITLEELEAKLRNSDKSHDIKAYHIKAYSLSVASQISTMLALQKITLSFVTLEFGKLPSGDIIQIGEPSFGIEFHGKLSPKSQPFDDSIRMAGFDGSPIEIPDRLVDKISRINRKVCQIVTGKDIA